MQGHGPGALANLNEGILVRDEVKTLSSVYPALYDVIRQVVMELLISIKGARPTWKPSYAKSRQLEVLLGISTITPELAAELQKAFATPEPQAPQGAGGSAPAPSMPEAEETPTQRAKAK